MVNVKILGISCSPRHGNTEILVKEALEEALKLGGVNEEFISLAGKKIQGGCKACYKCFTHEDSSVKPSCSTYDDDLNEVLDRMIKADGVIIGTPVYFGSISSQLKCLMDRSMIVYGNAGFLLRNKVGGAIATSADRHGGHEDAIHVVHKWFFLHDMIIVGTGPVRPTSGYEGAMGLQGWPNMVTSNTREALTAVKQDELAINTCRNLGRRVTEIAKVLKAGFMRIHSGELAWPYGPVTLSKYFEHYKK